jgi:hypothetical protein
VLVTLLIISYQQNKVARQRSISCLKRGVCPECGTLLVNVRKMVETKRGGLGFKSEK